MAAVASHLDIHWEITQQLNDLRHVVVVLPK